MSQAFELKFHVEQLTPVDIYIYIRSHGVENQVQSFGLYLNESLKKRVLT